MPQSEDSRALTLRDYVRVVRARVWLVVLVTVICAGTAFLVSNHQTRLYQASARLMYQPPADISSSSSGVSATDPNTLAVQQQSLIDMMGAPAVSASALREIGGAKATADIKVSAKVYVPPLGSSSGTSNLVEITAQATSPRVAAAAANAYAAAAIALRKVWEQEGYRASQQVVESQLKLFTTSQSKLTADYANLVQQLSYLQIAEATATGDFRVIVPATPPLSAASPKPMKSAALGFGIGLIAGIGLAFLMGRLDTRVQSHRQAAEILGQTILGRLPRVSRHALDRDPLIALSEPDGHYSEALRMLRTNLDWVSIDDRVSSLMLTSCIKGEGKTVTVCNLAVTLSRSGKNVIVVDADLRDPRVHRTLGLKNAIGLTSVVLGRAKVDDAMQVFALPQQPQDTVTVRSSGVRKTTGESRSSERTPAEAWGGV